MEEEKDEEELFLGQLSILPPSNLLVRMGCRAYSERRRRQVLGVALQADTKDVEARRAEHLIVSAG